MNQDTQALLDTGSVVTRLRPDLAGGKEGDAMEGGAMEVACVHGDTQVYATCHVTSHFSTKGGLLYQVVMVGSRTTTNAAATHSLEK